MATRSRLFWFLSWRAVRRSALAVVAAGLAVGGWAVTELAAPNPGLSQTLLAQTDDFSSDFSEAEIYSYAASVLAMDGPRTAALSEIQALLADVDQDITQLDLSCTTTQTLNRLPRSVQRQVRTLVIDYCNLAQGIVENNGLTVERFNAITTAHNQDGALAEQIRTALIKLQQADGENADAGTGQP